jgi:quercetin dioxygenase-like cupin family protein
MRLIEASEGKGVFRPRGRSAVLLVEQEISRMPQQVELPVKHEFAPSVYSRTLFIPKGGALAGRIHKHEHFNIVLSGTIAVLTEKGEKIIKGPAMFKGPPGVKRAGYALEDTVWVTVHPNPTEERNPDKLVEMLTVDSFEDLEDYVIEGEIVE